MLLPVHGDPPLRAGPYVRDLGPDSVVVSAVTAQAVIATAEVFAEDGTRVSSLEDRGPRRRHEFRFDGLRAGSGYTCRVTMPGSRTWEASIKTPVPRDESEVRFAFLGDSGDQPGWVWLQRAPLLRPFERADALWLSGPVERVGQAVAAWRPDFLLHLGDVVYPWGRHAQYRTGFFRPFDGVVGRAPCYPVIGNHDVLDDSGRQLVRLLGSPGRCGVAPRVGRIVWGPVRIVMLDLTGFRDDGPGAAASFDALDIELAGAHEPWLFVVSHFPIRSASNSRNRAGLMMHLSPRLHRWGVDLYLSGHDHCYQSLVDPEREDGVPMLVSGGGGKDLYEVRSEPGVVRSAAAHHWCGAVVQGARCRIDVVGIDGSSIDSLKLELADGPRLASLRGRNPVRADRIDRLRR